VTPVNGNSNASNGTEPNGPIEIPAVRPDAASLAEADAVLSRWVAERDRLHKDKDQMPAVDERLRKLCSAIDFLTTQIKVVRQMA
jgi:hypothetical protein